MEEIPLINDIVVIFGLSIGVLLLCHKIKLPSVVGFLFTGVICGPHALGLVKGEADVQTLASLGIVLLLFTVGMEFSFKKILESKRFFVIGGGLQVLLTVLVGLGVALLLNRPFNEALFLGFLLSLSSTAIVLRMIDEKRESDSPHGRVILGMMIFQDIIAIPMMLAIPILGGVSQGFDLSTLFSFGKGVIVLGAVLFLGAKLVPALLYQIAKTRRRELFLMSVITICSSVAWVTSHIGLSLSLGAFLAGLIISDSEYRTEAVGDILPFQDIFTSFFFVSVGMLLNLGFFIEQPFLILAVTAGVILLKGSIAGLATIILGMPLRTVVMAGVAMAQIGEFSFVLAKEGQHYALGGDYQYQLFLAVALLSMAFTPSLIQLAPYLATQLLRLPLPVKLKSGLSPFTSAANHNLKDHVIIIGFGISGRNLARSSRDANIPYLILEMNADTVKKEKLRGEPIHFGDASHEAVLHHANITEAKAVAVVINDPIAAGRIVGVARKLNPNSYIVVRTRYLSEMKKMYALGADEVIPDEYGSSIEVFTRVLREYKIPQEDLQRIISEMRIEGYEMLRLLFKEPTALSDLQVTLSDVEIETFRIPLHSHLVGKTLGELNLRKEYGVTAMLINRGNETITNLDSNTYVFANDIIVVVGTHDHLFNASKFFKSNRNIKQSETTT